MNDLGLPLKTAPLKIHPLAAIFPMLSDDELDELAADIKANGLLHPIVRMIDGVTIVDGRNRYEACRRAGVEPTYDDRIRTDDEARALIVSTNLQRRNLTKSQQAMALAMIYPEPDKTGRRKNGLETKPLPDGVHKSRLSQARAILRHSLEMAQSVIAGALSIDKALEQIEERAQQDAKPEARLAALRRRYADIAAQVAEGIFGIDAGETEANARDRREAEQREVIYRATDQALFNVTAFAVDNFTDTLHARLEDAVFRKSYLERLRFDNTTDYDDITARLNRGTDALISILAKLREGV